LNVSKASLDLQNKKGNSPLHFAARSKSIESAKRLISAGANVLLLNEKKQTPLHAAAFYGSVEVLKLLLENSKQDIDWQDEEGFVLFLLNLD